MPSRQSIRWHDSRKELPDLEHGAHVLATLLFDDGFTRVDMVRWNNMESRLENDYFDHPKAVSWAYLPDTWVPHGWDKEIAKDD